MRLRFAFGTATLCIFSACASATDGPAGQAESTDLIKGHDVDDAGNVVIAYERHPKDTAEPIRIAVRMIQ